MKTVLYGDVTLNIIDGSSVWLTSIANVLAEVAEEVHVVLKARVENTRLISAMANNSRITLHEVPDWYEQRELTPEAAAERIRLLDSELCSDLILVRGIDACEAASGLESVSSKLWSYVTELPFPYSRVNRSSAGRIWRIVSKSKRVFAQTEAARSYLESICSAAPGKVLLLPPMVPDSYFQRPDFGSENATELRSVRAKVGTRRRPLRLVYSGKLANDWRVEEMLELPRVLRERGIVSELEIVGDKFQLDRSNPGWVEGFQSKMLAVRQGAYPGVHWRGGLSRDGAVEVVANADIGLGWRSARLDSSLEISTKALEYSAAGAAPLINRSSDHEDVWGTDYPLFIDRDDIESVVDTICDNLEEVSNASDSANLVARAYSSSAAVRRLSMYLERAFPSLSAIASQPEPVRVGIASHDLKFMGELIEYLDSNPSFEVRVDPWRSLHDHDKLVSEGVLDWADVILCEWAGPNVVWYSDNIREGQRLYTRLHRFELWAPWMQSINFDSVSGVVFVSEYFRDKAVSHLGIDQAITRVIPNVVDHLDFDRPKLEDSIFRLGMLGMVSFGKRPDRALDLVEALAAEDERYSLHIRGRMPWEYEYEWKNGLQRELYLQFFERIRESSLLREHVVFERFGPDVASWLRKIGYILSPSTGRYESFHLAPAEGMASGSVPIVWPREGASEVFGSENVYPSVSAARDYILELQRNGGFEVASEASRDWSRKWDSSRVMDYWGQLLSGRL